MKSQLKELILFFTATMVIGLPIKYYFTHQKSYQSSSPSSAPFDKELAINNNVAAADQLPLSTVKEVKMEASANCVNCAQSVITNPTVAKIPVAPSFETAVTCGGKKGGRLFFEELLDLIPPSIRMPRSVYPDGQIPIACITTIMKKSFPSAEKKASKYFAKCERGPNSEPVRNQKKPCITEDYAYSVYNSLIDVSSCLDIDIRRLVPKIYTESGFHLNTYGMGLDTGIGQLTGDAIERVSNNMTEVSRQIKGESQRVDWITEPDVNSQLGGEQVSESVIEVANQEMAKVEKEVKNKVSSNPSCKNLVNADQAFKGKKIGKQTYKGIFSPISSDVKVRCNLMLPPENPVRNLLYTAIYNRVNQESILRKLKELDAFSRIEKLGLKLDDEQKNNFYQSLVLLAYNAGAGGVKVMLDSYMESFEKRVQNVAKESIVKTKKGSKDKKTETVVKADGAKVDNVLRASYFDYSQDTYLELQPLVQKYAGKQKVDRKNFGKLARKFREQIVRRHPISFPAFTRLFQESGSPLYLYNLALKKNEIDKEIHENGVGLCTPKHYLKL